MRICYVSHSNSHFTKPYVDFFVGRGHEVHLVSLFLADLPEAINHHPLPGPIDPERDKLIYPRALLRVRAIVRSLRPCIVHAHYVSSNGVLAAFAGVHPLIVSIRGGDLAGAGRRFRGILLKYALRRADVINPVSESFEPLLRSLGARSSRLLTLTQGVETERFATDRSRRASGPIRIVCTRSLAPHYDCHTIVASLVRLRERGVPFRFTFAATGPEERSLEREVLARGLSGQVTFLGGYTQDALPGILAEADVYVSAARSDGASISLLEALASGAFPVVSDVPGNRDWLSGRGDGLLFRAGEVDDLAACLASACADETLRRSAVDRNLALVRRRGERRTNLEHLEGIYVRLAGASDQRSGPKPVATGRPGLRSRP